MYDAIGVRQETGKQAKVLNRLLFEDLLKLDSVVQCENPERMSKARIGAYITTLPESYMKQIAAASLLATSAISYLDMEFLISVWKKAVALNSAVPA